MKALCLIFLIISGKVLADNAPLPPSVLTIDEIVNEFRNTLTTKLGEIGKNFIAKSSDKTIIYTNNVSMKCNGEVIPQGDPVVGLQYNFKITGNELIEKATYSGCKSEISLVEDVVTRGTSLVPLSYNDFIKGKRTFELSAGQMYRLYRISNAENEEIFKLLIEKSDTTQLAEFYILGQKFLRISLNYQENSTRADFTYFGYAAKYVRKHASWSFDNSFDPFTNTIVSSKESAIQFVFYAFSTQFDQKVTSSSIARIRKIMDYHNYYFPTTTVVQTGASNERLKAELRVTLNRLQNNVELNLVKKQIQDYIDAAENSLIIDNRPKQ
jgi:hypothetical protein